MPRRRKPHDFTRGTKRKFQPAFLHCRSASQVLTCERCGETEDVKAIPTAHGTEHVCYPCRCAHQTQKIRSESRFDFAE